MQLILGMSDIVDDVFEAVDAELIDDSDNCNSDKKGGRGPGRPKFKPTLEERNCVRNLARLGFSYEIIASSIRDGIDPDTLKRSFRLDLAAGRDEGAKRVAETLMTRMLDPDIDCDAVRFKYLKHTAGFTDDVKKQVEHSTKGGEPLEIKVSYVKQRVIDADC